MFGIFQTDFNSIVAGLHFNAAALTLLPLVLHQPAKPTKRNLNQFNRNLKEPKFVVAAAAANDVDNVDDDADADVADDDDAHNKDAYEAVTAAYNYIYIYLYIYIFNYIYTLYIYIYKFEEKSLCAIFFHRQSSSPFRLLNKSANVLHAERFFFVLAYQKQLK